MFPPLSFGAALGGLGGLGGQAARQSPLVGGQAQAMQDAHNARDRYMRAFRGQEAPKKTPKNYREELQMETDEWLDL